MDPIETILSREYPGLKVEIPSIPENSDITQEELTNTLRYIKQYKILQDATSILSQITPPKDSVIYPVHFPNRFRDLSFRVDWRQGPMVFVGYIQSSDKLGREVNQARFYGMRLDSIHS